MKTIESTSESSTPERSIDVEKLKTWIQREYSDHETIREHSSSPDVSSYAYGRMCSARLMAALVKVELIDGYGKSLVKVPSVQNAHTREGEYDRTT